MLPAGYDGGRIAHELPPTLMFGRRVPEVTVKKIGRCMIGAQPGGMKKEIMNFVRKHNLLKRDTLFSKRFHQVDHFLEGYCSIVVPLDQQHRRPPGFDMSQWRRFKGHPLGFGLPLRVV